MAVERVLVEKHIEIPMRDGIVLRADLYRPLDADRPGRAVPGIVTRTPYDKEQSGSGPVAVAPSPLKLAERGYAVVVCDCRGRYASEGEFSPFHQEGADGYDTLEWVAAQEWCDGQTAIYGASYVGATTLLAALEQPPSLRCAIPIITADDYHDGWTYQGGAFQLGFVGLWGSGLAVTGYLQRDHARPPEAQAELTEAIMGNAVRLLGSRPLNAMPGISRPGVAPYWHEWLAHETRDAYWESLRHSADYSRYQVPMLHIGGWFDIFGIGTVRNFRGMAAEGHPEQHLIMGPWAHTSYDRRLGEMEFGPTGAAVAAHVIADINAFLDRHLKGDDREARQLPRARWFLMGANEWRADPSWPPPNAVERTLYLASLGHRFDIGHRIRLELSSSNYPRFMANPNDGGSANSATDMQPAINTIRRGGAYPSALRFHQLRD